MIHIGGESAESVGPLTVGRQLSSPQIESELLYFRKHYGVKGVAGAVLLSVLGDLMKACNSLLRRSGFATSQNSGPTYLDHAQTACKYRFGVSGNALMPNSKAWSINEVRRCSHRS